MTQPQTTVSRAQAGIRAFICAQCHRKPAGTAPREGESMPCEPRCEVFLLLPRLCDLVQRHRPEPPCGFGLAVRNLLRQARESHAIVSEASDVETSLPLHLHAESAMAVIEHVLRTER